MKFTVAFIMAIFMLSVIAPTSVLACEDGARRACGSDTGVCEAGRSVCRNGVWGECINAKGADAYNDICGNELDDNCNGEIDENCFTWLPFILVGGGLVFIGIGLFYMNREKNERMLSDGIAKD